MKNLKKFISAHSYYSAQNGAYEMLATIKIDYSMAVVLLNLFLKLELQAEIYKFSQAGC